MGSASAERVGHVDCADYCMLINDWVWLRSRVLLINAGNGLGFSFGGRVWTEIEIWRIKGMFILKVVSNEKNLGFKGTYIISI